MDVWSSRNDARRSNELSGKNWIILESVGGASFVNTQILISCGCPADCINIQLLFESYRDEIWTWMIALQPDREAKTALLLSHKKRHTWSHQSKTWWPKALFHFQTDTGQIQTGTVVWNVDLCDASVVLLQTKEYSQWVASQLRP